MFPLPEKIIEQIYNKYDNFMLFETRKTDNENFSSYFFVNPVSTIKVFELSSIKDAFDKIEQHLQKGYFVAGWISYETGYGLDYISDKPVQQKYQFPLLHLSVFKKAIVFNHKTGKFYPNLPFRSKNSFTDLNYRLNNFRFNVSQQEYVNHINKIKQYIAAGDTYQVNYTLKSRFNFHGSKLGLYYNLRNTQKVAYASLIKTKKRIILSFSPELFFRKHGNTIIMRPMKGTIKRGKTSAEDKSLELELFNSKKNRAENVMIVDLIRNDLGRISRPANVKTSSLFNIEKYETLYQMTSTITTKVSSNLELYDLFKSIFPSGSVTGAPKIRTMQIINQLEKEPRYVYTGAIGFFSHSNAVFNVPIRTAIIEGNQGELGIGSGITYVSGPVDEYEECKLKSLFLTQKHVPFQLIESMLFENVKDTFHWNGYYLFDQHIQRLAGSAEYFGFDLLRRASYSIKKIKQELSKLRITLNKNKMYKIRLLLSQGGKIKTEISNVGAGRVNQTPTKVILSPTKTNPDNIFLYHKTTIRDLYNREYEKYHKLGYFDVLYMNRFNEITEFSRGNIIIKKRNKFYTPPISCGLLPGVYLNHFTKLHKWQTIEKVLNLKDLKSADKIYFVNSVRKMIEVKLKARSSKLKVWDKAIDNQK